MTKEYSLEVKNEKGRLDKFVSEQIPDLSRTRVKELVKDQNILVNGKVEKVSYKIQAGDKIEVNIPAVKPLDVIPENIPLDIVYEDDDVIVVNKPQGMVVHPAPGHPDHTLVNALLYHTKALAQSPEGFRPGIVHRLDKDTSGVMVIAKNENAMKALQRQFAERETEKHYRALAKGVIPEMHGFIDFNIERDPRDRKLFHATERKDRGKTALTEYSVIRILHRYTLLDLHIHTGRTHQIRVHLKAIGHPILGDPLYGVRDPEYSTATLMLHSFSLDLNHPVTGERMHFEAKLPEYFEDMVKKLSD